MSNSQQPRIYYIYKLTRSDGKQYIGTTDSVCFKNRMCHHKISPRFAGYTFTCEILESGFTKELHEKEAWYITQENTLQPMGLNIAKDGKGNHCAPTFTTRGYVFSAESRQKMSESSKRRVRTTGWKHSAEVKKHWSTKRQGKCFKKPSLTEAEWNSLCELWNAKPSCIMINGAGKQISYERAFAKTFAERYGLTPNGLYNLVANKLKVFRFPGKYPLSNSDA